MTTKTSSKKREVRAKSRDKFKKRGHWIIVLTTVIVLATCVVAYYSSTRRSGERESSFWGTSAWAEEGKVVVIGSPTLDCFTDPCQLEITVRNNSSEVITVHGVVLYFLVNGDMRRVDIVINETLNPGEVKSFISAIKGVDLSMIANIQSGELITSIGKVRLEFIIPI